MFGLLQLFIVKKLVVSLSVGNPGKVLLFGSFKMLMWGLFFAIIAIFFPKDILVCGSAAAAGLVLGSFGLFGVSMYKQFHSEKKEI